MEADVRDALRYFSLHNHPDSFEYLSGKGHVLFSAPHAVLQTRNGCIKQAERYTGMLCRLLNQRYGLPCIYKSRHLKDDANHDAQSPYRDEVGRLVRQEGFRYVLDLHQLSPARPMALCIGTGNGRHLAFAKDAPGLIRSIFESHGLAPVTLDDPFAASAPHTVSASAAVQGAAAMQLEINTSLLMENTPTERFESVLAALAEAAQELQRK